MKTLLIVESPSKCSTIQEYLGDDFIVLSSKGHIRDLARSGKEGLGLDIENNFKPKYSKMRKQFPIIKELKLASKGNNVLLATDPDREGEAISWHLAEVLELDINEENRVVFNEITKNAILKALKNKRKLDMDLVHSQECRRGLDRVIGFKLSKLLQKKIKSRSAGRVQSVALKLIVDLEKEIQAFVPEEYWTVFSKFPKFEANLTHFKDEKLEINNEKEANDILDNLSEQYIVEDIKTKETKRNPKDPFTTSTLQQEAASRLNFAPSKTMIIAQALYEGKQIGKKKKGLITYMRTDSKRIATVFSTACKKEIESTYGLEYLSDYISPKKNKSQQDAHEAIRPTSIKNTPDSLKKHLNNDEFRLYSLIYARTVAAFMQPARFEHKSLVLDNNNYKFKTTGNKMIFDGFIKVYKKYTSVDEKKFPSFKVGDKINAEEVIKEQHFTKPKSRFSQASLIKELEENGIGRPSTYAATINVLKKRFYIEIEQKKLIPTEQGIRTIDALDEFFHEIINVDYTAQMENDLDDVAQGKADAFKVIGDFYHHLTPLIEHAQEHMIEILPEETGEMCPECGAPMVIRLGRFGKFEACSAYPECSYIKKDPNKPEPVKTGIKCPLCDSGEIVERVAMKGRNKGKSFYACNAFPRCRYTISNKPTDKICPDCGKLLVIKNDEIKCEATKCPSNAKKTKKKKK